MFENDDADLFDLVRLGLSVAGLKIQDLFHPVLDEYVMASPYPLLETEPLQEMTDRGERNVRVRSAAKNRFENSIGARHSAF